MSYKLVMLCNFRNCVICTVVQKKLVFPSPVSLQTYVSDLKRRWLAVVTFGSTSDVVCSCVCVVYRVV